MDESIRDKLIELVEDFLFRSSGSTRFTQDSPILPDVWLGYARQILDREPGERSLEVLLTAHRDSDPSELAYCLRKRLNAFLDKGNTRSKTAARKRWRIAHNETAVVADLTFNEVICVALPLTKWWEKYLVYGEDEKVSRFLKSPVSYRAGLEKLFNGSDEDEDEDEDDTESESSDLELPRFDRNLKWLAQMVGLFVELDWIAGRKAPELPEEKEVKNAVLARLDETLVDRIIFVLDNAILPGVDEAAMARTAYQRHNQFQLWSINLNRATEPSVYRSVRAVKADATQSLFDVRGESICWAVIDSGIDARHFAFRRRDSQGRPLGPGGQPIVFDRRGTYVLNQDTQERTTLGARDDTGPFVKHPRTGKWLNQTRIVKSLDFSLMRDILSSEGKMGLLPDAVKAKLGKPGMRGFAKDLRTALKFNRVIDWELLEPLLEVTHDDEYSPPEHHHGTHVAGIIGADWRKGEHKHSPSGPRSGIAPGIQLYDLRALGPNGIGDEFTILAAMQYVRSLNARNNQMQIHGVNLSFSIRHQVANYGCGRTPVCVESERLVGSGVVVVAAAGNRGRARYATKTGFDEGYRDVSITDPGNAEAVITVGATHRYKPHNYGVSYFSSRGPTGDGRLKPDLVAPGEKIFSTIPDNKEVELDGTSMAAPHVSGAAALLMERNIELIGQPQRIKHVLCSSATDLGRERYFQGAGMLDTLRSLQSV